MLSSAMEELGSQGGCGAERSRLYGLPLPSRHPYMPLHRPGDASYAHAASSKIGVAGHDGFAGEGSRRASLSSTSSGESDDESEGSSSLLLASDGARVPCWLAGRSRRHLIMPDHDDWIRRPKRRRSISPGDEGSGSASGAERDERPFYRQPAASAVGYAPPLRHASRPLFHDPFGRRRSDGGGGGGSGSGSGNAGRETSAPGVVSAEEDRGVSASRSCLSRGGSMLELPQSGRSARGISHGGPAYSGPANLPPPLSLPAHQRLSDPSAHIRTAASFDTAQNGGGGGAAGASNTHGGGYRYATHSTVQHAPSPMGNGSTSQAMSGGAAYAGVGSGMPGGHVPQPLDPRDEQRGQQQTLGRPRSGSPSAHQQDGVYGAGARGNSGNLFYTGAMPMRQGVHFDQQGRPVFSMSTPPLSGMSPMPSGAAVGADYMRQQQQPQRTSAGSSLSGASPQGRSHTQSMDMLTSALGQPNRLSFEYAATPMYPPTMGAMEFPRADTSGGLSGSDVYRTGTAGSGSDRPSSDLAVPAQGMPGTANATAANAATRKQNSACDACRRRKVRCIRVDDDPQCLLCKSKGAKCTSIYVSQVTAAPRKPGKRAKLEDDGEAGGDAAADDISPRTSALLRFLCSRTGNLYSSRVEPSGSLPNDGTSAPWPTEAEARESLLPYLPAPSSSIEATLMTAAARYELANDLIDTYFSIHHPRLPLLDPKTFRERFFAGSLVDPGTGAGESEPMLAAVLLWGTKFSTHPIIVDDRLECAEALRERRQARENRVTTGKKKAGQLTPEEEVEEHLPAQLRMQGISRIAEALWIRLGELYETKRVFHNATDDNIVALMIVNGYHPAWPRLPTAWNKDNGKSIVATSCDSYDDTYLRAALKHMRKLKYDRKETIERIEDKEHRRRMSTCWWIMLLVDAYTAALYQRQPQIKPEDYTTEPPFAVDDSTIDAPNISGATSGQAMWMRSQADFIELCHQLCNTVWAPRNVQNGVKLPKLLKLVSAANEWRDAHLSNVGVPKTWPQHWDFVAAISACTSEKQFAMMWISMFLAVEQHGIDCDASETEKADQLQRKVYNEALQWSLRLTDLANMLVAHGYLRLDGNMIRIGLQYAGYCLARFQRLHEVQILVRALHQYGVTTEESYDQAERLENFAHECMNARPATAPSAPP